jgi:hypothetical protein
LKFLTGTYFTIKIKIFKTTFTHLAFFGLCVEIVSESDKVRSVWKFCEKNLNYETLKSYAIPFLAILPSCLGTVGAISVFGEYANNFRLNIY